MYLSWALFCEGNSDRDYFEALIPRILEDIVLKDGKFSVEIPSNYWVSLGRKGRTVDAVAAEACAAREAFQILFIHADTGGRAIQNNIADRADVYVDRMHQLCEFRKDRAVIIAPRHETEAWVMADSTALLTALGYRDPTNSLNLPQNAASAERLPDPKSVLTTVINTVYRNRVTAKREVSFAAVAFQQNLESLRASASFREFELNLRKALATWGIV